MKVVILAGGQKSTISNEQEGIPKPMAEIGGKPSGVSIVATCQDKLLLLHEFRMGVNRYVYNLCAGMLEPDESIEKCIVRGTL